MRTPMTEPLRPKDIDAINNPVWYAENESESNFSDEFMWYYKSELTRREWRPVFSYGRFPAPRPALWKRIKWWFEYHWYFTIRELAR